MTTLITLTTPTTRIESLRLRRFIAPAAAGMLGLSTSLIGITSASVWYDEAATITSATRSWAQLWDMIGTVDAVHAAYYVLMHVVFDLVGYSPLALRLPSAIAVGLTAALLVLFARQFGRPRLGIVAAVVFVLLPRTTWMGTEGRSYAITALLALVVTMALVHAVHAKTRRSWVVYGLLVVLSCVVFIYLALIVVAHGLAMLRWASTRSGNAAPSARRWLIASSAAAIALIPLAIVVIGESGQVHWLDPTSASTVDDIVLTQWFYSSLPFAIVGWGLMVMGCVFLSRRRGLSLGSLVVPLIVAPTLLLVLVSFAMPLYTPRYVAMCLPFVAVAIGAAIDRIQSPLPIALSLLALGTLALPQAIEQRQPEARDSSSWSQVADWIAADRAADGPGAMAAMVYGNVYGHPSATTRVIEYSYPEAFRGTLDMTLETPAAVSGRLWETTAPLEDRLFRASYASTIYLVTSTSRDQRELVTSILADDGWVIDDSASFTGVNIVKYERG